MGRACYSNGHDPSVSEAAVLLEMRDVTKSFGTTRALDGVSLGVDSGEVRALIGENGAGKSTLMKVLSGAHRPDSGLMTLDGLPYAPRGPRDARARGVAMIYQELALAPDLTVEANVMLGQERVRAAACAGENTRSWSPRRWHCSNTPTFGPRRRWVPWAWAPSNWSRWRAPWCRAPGSSSSMNRPARFPSTTPNGYSRSSSGFAPAAWRSFISAIFLKNRAGSPRRIPS